MSQGPINASADADADVERSRTGSRLRVLAVLRASADSCGVREVAGRTGLHPNTVRFHLERLEEDGLVSRQPRRSGEPGRPPLTYTATPVPDVGGEHREFARLAEVLAQALRAAGENPATAAVAAGRSWGQALVRNRAAAPGATDAISELTEALLKTGFAPQVRPGEDDGRTIILQRHCPFLEVAQTHPDVVCSVHLGLIRGVLEKLGTPVVADRLIPFASPAGCEAHLTRG